MDGYKADPKRSLFRKQWWLWQTSNSNLAVQNERFHSVGRLISWWQLWSGRWECPSRPVNIPKNVDRSWWTCPSSSSTYDRSRLLQIPAPPSATGMMSILLVMVSLISVMIMSHTYDETGSRCVSVKKKTEEKIIQRHQWPSTGNY